MQEGIVYKNIYCGESETHMHISADEYSYWNKRKSKYKMQKISK